MANRGTRGAYRKEDRVALPKELQKELVTKAAARAGNCQELAKRLNIPKSSVHYYQVCRITMPISVLEGMLAIAADEDLAGRIKSTGVEKDRTWANEYAVSVYREMCREKHRLPMLEELERDDDLRRKAAAIISYVMAEGSVWLQKEKWGECAVNITFAAHERDLYEHFRSLCRDVFLYDIGPPQEPGNGAMAIRGFIYTRFIAEWLIKNGVMPGEKSSRVLHLPSWVMRSSDRRTWIAAIQPWCDGEGCVLISAEGRLRGFSVAQARHTDLDFEVLPHPFTWRGTARTMRLDRLGSAVVFGISAREYCMALSRSEVLEDVKLLLRRLGFVPRIGIRSLYLKDDGFWSCSWTIELRSSAVIPMVKMGLIRQSKKVEKIARCAN
jgi:hypothetical protein